MRKSIMAGFVALILAGVASPALADPIVLRQITAWEWSYPKYRRTDFDYALYGVQKWYNHPPRFYNGWAWDYPEPRHHSLRGGTYFNTDLFSRGYTDTVEIWWDFTTNPFYNMRQIAAQTINLDTGHVSEYFFTVHRPFWEASGHVTIKGVEGEVFRNILFQGAGKAIVPEMNSLVLLLFALPSLFLVRRLQQSGTA